jgi:hypothetical protein
MLKDFFLHRRGGQRGIIKEETLIYNRIRKDIFNGIGFGILLLLISLINTYISIFHLHIESIKLGFYFFQILFISLCILGMFKKSKIAGVSILLYIIFIKIVKIAMGSSLNLADIILTLIFIYYFYKANVAIFKFHRLKI